MRDRRVVVTGLGAITPLANTLDATREALERGLSAIGPATVFDASGFRCSSAGEIRDWDPRPSFRAPKALKLTDRPARFAVAAAQMALSGAGWPATELARERLGVVVGASGSDLQARDIGRALRDESGRDRVGDIPAFAEKMLRGLNPLWLLVSLPNMISAHVAIQMLARGPNSTVMSDWAAGLQAIGEAAEWIACGETDAALAGGADSGVQPFAYAAFEQAALFGDGICGFVPGEGAAMLVLEERETARNRGATVRAELRAYHTRAGDPEAVQSTLTHTLSHAVRSAGWTPRDVALCSVAAPPGVFEQPVRNAIDEVFGDVEARVSFDRRLGFPLAAAGPIDAALTIASSPRGTRFISSSLGLSGEAVTLAFDLDVEE